MRFTQNIKAEKPIKLDLKDKKILYWLSQNARTPYTRLAKKVALSKDSIKYRINKLENAGIVQGYLTVVNVNKFGFSNYHLFLQLNKANKQVRKHLVKTIEAYPFIHAILEFSGRYDFEIALIAKTIEELDSIISKILSDLSEYLQDHQILVISKPYETRTFPRSFYNVESERPGKSSIVMKIDKTDIEILKVLSKKATSPLYEIASKVKLSADAVNYRIKKMVRSGFILKYIPIINYSALGYTIYSVLMNIHNLDAGKEKRLKYFLSNNENTLWAVKTIGKYNLLMYVCVKKSEALHNTLISLREMFSSDIRDYETLIAYEEYKYDYFPEACYKE